MKRAHLVSNHGLLTENLRVCSNFWERARGLIARPALGVESNEGLWIPKCGSVHTVFMRYPIDVVFLDRSGRVLSISRNLKPYRAAAVFSATSVIEFNVGTVVVDKIAVGDQLFWRQ